MALDLSLGSETHFGGKGCSARQRVQGRASIVAHDVFNQMAHYLFPVLRCWWLLAARGAVESCVRKATRVHHDAAARVPPEGF